MISIACNSTEMMFVLLTLGFVVSHHIYQRYRTFRLMLFYTVNFGCIKLDLPLEANESEIESNDNQFPVLIRENVSIFCRGTLFNISINFKINTTYIVTFLHGQRHFVVLFLWLFLPKNNCFNSKYLCYKS